MSNISTGSRFRDFYALSLVMSFFIRKGGDWSKNLLLQAKKREDDDKEIDSVGSDIEGRGDAGYESEEDNETPDEKRLRSVKLYLAEVERELSERNGNKEDLATEVGERLKEDVEEEEGKLVLPN